jgi:C_GCAxxG_C_C family probable redox protein
VLASLASLVNLDEQTAFKLTSPFGGGIARRGQVCGAVSGALMALGLKYGHTHPAGREDALKMTGEFLRRFEARHQSILCRDLIQCDLTTPEGRQQSSERDVHHTICAGLVREAAEIASEMMSARN